MCRKAIRLYRVNHDIMVTYVALGSEKSSLQDFYKNKFFKCILFLVFICIRVCPREEDRHFSIYFVSLGQKWLWTLHDREHNPKKVREKSRECHNHKPKHFTDTKRKRKPTKLNKHKWNKRTKSI